MPTLSFKKRLKALSLPNKVVGIGALVGIVSVFLPWYKDIDRFHTGDMFLGITGPLYLLGATLLLLFGGSLALVISEAMQKEFVKLPVKKTTFHMLAGGGGLYLLCLAYSIFFHPQFGLNLVDKQPMFGLFGVLVASALVGYGGHLLTKGAGVRSPKMEQVRQQITESVMRQHQQVQQPVNDVSQQVPVNANPTPAHHYTDDIQIKSDLPQRDDRPQA